MIMKELLPSPNTKKSTKLIRGGIVAGMLASSLFIASGEKIEPKQKSITVEQTDEIRGEMSTIEMHIKEGHPVEFLNATIVQQLPKGGPEGPSTWLYDNPIVVRSNDDRDLFYEDLRGFGNRFYFVAMENGQPRVAMETFDPETMSIMWSGKEHATLTGTVREDTTLANPDRFVVENIVEYKQEGFETTAIPIGRSHIAMPN